MNFKFWGDGSQGAKDLVDAILVRDTNNFNWSFIFILAVVFYVYWSEMFTGYMKSLMRLSLKLVVILYGRYLISPQHLFF